MHRLLARQLEMLGLAPHTPPPQAEWEALLELVGAAYAHKSGFLANMSEELRRPLSAIIGFARLLESRRFGDVAPRGREYIGYILRASQHVLHLVDDLLDLSRLEANRAVIAATRVSIAPLVDEALQLVKPLIDEKEHVVHVALDAELPEALADQGALLQVLVNLLGNAAKFTPEGGRIAIQAVAEPDAIRIEVTDSGIGIAPDDVPTLFTYVEELGAKQEHHMHGSGIGLALTRGLVEKMGGAIRVESARGAGSTFAVSVPRCSEAP